MGQCGAVLPCFAGFSGQQNDATKPKPPAAKAPATAQPSTASASRAQNASAETGPSLDAARKPEKKGMKKGFLLSKREVAVGAAKGEEPEKCAEKAVEFETKGQAEREAAALASSTIQEASTHPVVAPVLAEPQEAQVSTGAPQSELAESQAVAASSQKAPSEEQSAAASSQSTPLDEKSAVATAMPEMKPATLEQTGDWEMRPVPDATGSDVDSWKDVSPAQNGSLRKYVLSASTVNPTEEGVTPTDGASVEFEFAWRALKIGEEDLDPTEGWAFTGDAQPRKIKLTLGDCECCDALESALSSMKRGETCVVRCGAEGRGNPYDWTDKSLGFCPQGSGGSCTLDMLITLLWCEKEKDVMEMEAADRAKYASERKDAAAKYFKTERYIAALNKYKLVAEVLDYTDDIKDPTAQLAAKALRRAAKVNEAACSVKLCDWVGTIRACDEVLKDQAGNEKALFRRATAYMKQGEHLRAEADLKRCLEINSENQEARRLLAQCKAEAKEFGQSQKDVFAKMLQGKGKKKAKP